MKHITTLNHTALLSLLSLGLAASAVQAQQPDSKKPADLEKSDPFTKGAAGTDSKTAKDQGAEMLDAQARILFARGETEKAIALQTQAVEKARDTAQKFANTLAKYAGKPMDGPVIKKLDEIIFPQINFEDASLQEAVDFLRLRSTELDEAEPDPKKKGVNIVLVQAKVAATDPVKGNSEAPTAISEPRIKELRIKNAPLSVALQYICDATHYYYTVDGISVVLKPLATP
jgi:hypothetical protein